MYAAAIRFVPNTGTRSSTRSTCSTTGTRTPRSSTSTTRSSSTTIRILGPVVDLHEVPTS